MRPLLIARRMNLIERNESEHIEPDRAGDSRAIKNLIKK